MQHNHVDETLPVFDMLAVIQMKFHTEFQSVKEELGKAHSRLPSMEEVVNCLPSLWLIDKINLMTIYFTQQHKREIKQLKPLRFLCTTPPPS